VRYRIASPLAKLAGTVCGAPGVVIDQPGAVIGLGDAANWAEPQVREMLGLDTGQEEDAPKAGDLLSKLVVDIVGSKGGGVVILGGVTGANCTGAPPVRRV
jgi:hypothetical protein